jgi:hypothetical protein
LVSTNALRRKVHGTSIVSRGGREEAEAEVEEVLNLVHCCGDGRVGS